jgi:acetoacetyl-CoA synthetase
MSSIKKESLLWEPSSSLIESSNMYAYMAWLQDKKGRKFSNYHDLWQWSVSDVEEFWLSIFEYFEVTSSSPFLRVLNTRNMPGAKWFEGAKLNYTEHIFRDMDSQKEAIIFQSEIQPQMSLTWGELYSQVATFASALKSHGITQGDRVVAYISNMPQAIIGFLACASIGAIWSSCSPDFGSRTVINRFKQIEPKLMLAIDGYKYNGKDFNRMAEVKKIQEAIPSLEKTVMIPYLNKNIDPSEITNSIVWDDFISGHNKQTLEFTHVPFDHPLWVLYSSGTTGLPKAIVQGHGGILLEQYKSTSLHMNLKPEDRFFWFTTTGWMMWNVVVSGLLTRSTIILFDGNPGYPDLNTMWRFAEQTKMTVFGTSANFLTSCMQAGITPGNDFDLKHLKAIGSTGSPLSDHGFDWVYNQVKEDLWLCSTSGGTDICSSLVGGNPLLPVYRGEIQSRYLGAAVYAYNEDAKQVTNEVGELVVTEPIPSMPLYFWNDPDGERLHESYFSTFPNVWRHGDWIEITERGTSIIYGRSDSTINRGGIRMGTSEIYSVVENIDEIIDSLVLDVKKQNGDLYMPLFIVLRDGETLTDQLKDQIRQRIRENCSPRHVPNDIFTIEDVPRTLNGKKLEVPIKKILMGTNPDKAINKDSISNPNSIDYFIKFAQKNL